MVARDGERTVDFNIFLLVSLYRWATTVKSAQTISYNFFLRITQKFLAILFTIIRFSGTTYLCKYM
jgi:hypothetical protein